MFSDWYDVRENVVDFVDQPAALEMTVPKNGHGNDDVKGDEDVV